MRSIDLRKFPFQAFLYSVFFVCCFHTPTKATGTNSWFLSFCGCGGETENDRPTSPSKLSPNTIDREGPPHSSPKNKEGLAAEDEEAVPLLQAGNGILHETSADEERPVSLAEDTDSILISLSIQESDGSSVLEDHDLKNHLTRLLNRKRPSRLDVSLINKEGNCLGNAQFCTYTVGTEPKLPSPKPSKSSVKDNQAMKPLLDNQPFSEKMIGKTSRSILGMQIEDIAWTYAEHFFNELEKKKDDNLLFSYYGYKLPGGLAFARIETSTIVYDLTLPRKEGVGSVASFSTARTAKKLR